MANEVLTVGEQGRSTTSGGREITYVTMPYQCIYMY